MGVVKDVVNKVFGGASGTGSPGGFEPASAQATEVSALGMGPGGARGMAPGRAEEGTTGAHGTDLPIAGGSGAYFLSHAPAPDSLNARLMEPLGAHVKQLDATSSNINPPPQWPSDERVQQAADVGGTSIPLQTTVNPISAPMQPGATFSSEAPHGLSTRGMGVPLPEVVLPGAHGPVPPPGGQMAPQLGAIAALYHSPAAPQGAAADAHLVKELLGGMPPPQPSSLPRPQQPLPSPPERIPHPPNPVALQREPFATHTSTEHVVPTSAVPHNAKEQIHAVAALYNSPAAPEGATPEPSLVAELLCGFEPPPPSSLKPANDFGALTPQDATVLTPAVPNVDAIAQSRLGDIVGHSEVVAPALSTVPVNQQIGAVAALYGAEVAPGGAPAQADIQAVSSLLGGFEPPPPSRLHPHNDLKALTPEATTVLTPAAPNLEALAHSQLGDVVGHNSEATPGLNPVPVNQQIGAVAALYGADMAPGGAPAEADPNKVRALLGGFEPPQASRLAPLQPSVTPQPPVESSTTSTQATTGSYQQTTTAVAGALDAVAAHVPSPLASSTPTINTPVASAVNVLSAPANTPASVAPSMRPVSPSMRPASPSMRPASPSMRPASPSMRPASPSIPSSGPIVTGISSGADLPIHTRTPVLSKKRLGMESGFRAGYVANLNTASAAPTNKFSIAAPAVPLAPGAGHLETPGLAGAEAAPRPYEELGTLATIHHTAQSSSPRTASTSGGGFAVGDRFSLSPATASSPPTAGSSTLQFAPLQHDTSVSQEQEQLPALPAMHMPHEYVPQLAAGLAPPPVSYQQHPSLALPQRLVQIQQLHEPVHPQLLREPVPPQQTAPVVPPEQWSHTPVQQEQPLLTPQPELEQPPINTSELSFNNGLVPPIGSAGAGMPGVFLHSFTDPNNGYERIPSSSSLAAGNLSAADGSAAPAPAAFNDPSEFTLGSGTGAVPGMGPSASSISDTQPLLGNMRTSSQAPVSFTAPPAAAMDLLAVAGSASSVPSEAGSTAMPAISTATSFGDLSTRSEAGSAVTPAVHNTSTGDLASYKDVFDPSVTEFVPSGGMAAPGAAAAAAIAATTSIPALRHVGGSVGENTSRIDSGVYGDQDLEGISKPVRTYSSELVTVHDQASKAAAAAALAHSEGHTIQQVAVHDHASNAAAAAGAIHQQSGHPIQDAVVEAEAGFGGLADFSQVPSVTYGHHTSTLSATQRAGQPIRGDNMAKAATNAAEDAFTEVPPVEDDADVVIADKNSSITQGVYDTTASAAGTAVNALQGTARQAADTAGQVAGAVAGMGAAAAANTAGVAGAAVNTAAEAASNITGTAYNVASNAAATVKDTAASAVNTAGQVAGAAAGLGAAAAANTAGAAGAAYDTASSTAGTIANSTTETASNAAGAAYNAAGTAATAVQGTAASAVNTAGKVAGAVGAAGALAAVNTVGALTAAGDVLASVAGAAAGSALAVKDRAVEAAKGAVGVTQAKAASASDATSEAASNVASAAGETAAGTKDAAFDAAATAGQYAATAGDAVKSVAADAYNSVASTSIETEGKGEVAGLEPFNHAPGQPHLASSPATLGYGSVTPASAQSEGVPVLLVPAALAVAQHGALVGADLSDVSSGYPVMLEQGEAGVPAMVKMASVEDAAAAPTSAAAAVTDLASGAPASSGPSLLGSTDAVQGSYTAGPARVASSTPQDGFDELQSESEAAALAGAGSSPLHFTGVSIGSEGRFAEASQWPPASPLQKQLSPEPGAPYGAVQAALAEPQPPHQPPAAGSAYMAAVAAMDGDTLLTADKAAALHPAPAAEVSLGGQDASGSAFHAAQAAVEGEERSECEEAPQATIRLAGSGPTGSSKTRIQDPSTGEVVQPGEDDEGADETEDAQAVSTEGVTTQAARPASGLFGKVRRFLGGLGTSAAAASGAAAGTVMGTATGLIPHALKPSALEEQSDEEAPPTLEGFEKYDSSAAEGDRAQPLVPLDVPANVLVAHDEIADAAAAAGKLHLQGQPIDSAIDQAQSRLAAEAAV